MASGRIRIGLSGWAYKHWRGDFYPRELRQADELIYAAARFPTLEINRTFYSLVEPRNMRDWRDRVPRDFRFAVKGSRFITHNKKLSDIEEPMARFLASGLVELEEKLGPILWQLAPNLRFNRDPSAVHGRPAEEAGESEAASRDRASPRELLRPRPGPHRPRPQCRNRLSHSSGWPFTEELTAGFVYIRLHGPRALYSSAYSRRELEGWAHRIEVWAAGNEPNDARRLTDLEPPPRKRRDVYVYFDNDSGGHAPRQAMNLIRLLGSAHTKG